MNRNKKTNIQAYLIVVGVIYLLFSFINIDLNPLQWGGFSRAISGIMLITFTFKLLTD